MKSCVICNLPYVISRTVEGTIISWPAKVKSSQKNGKVQITSTFFTASINCIIILRLQSFPNIFHGSMIQNSLPRISWYGISKTLYRINNQLTTPFSQMTDILSSTPLTPFGIFLKSSLPRAFWSALNVQLSVPVTCRSPLKYKMKIGPILSMYVDCKPDFMT